MAGAASLLLLIGTYTSEGAEGIYAADFNPVTGAISAPRCVAPALQPSSLAVRPGATHLYAVNELSDPGGAGGGTVSAFTLSAETGDLALINTRPSSGGAPCHVSCHPDGRWVAVANYASGTVAVFPVSDDGALGEASCIASHPTLPGARGMLRSPCAHGLVFAPGGEFAFAPDLGIDRLMVYRFDPEKGTLRPHDPAFLETRRGAGPRSLSLHPDGRRACLANELDSTLSLLELDPVRGGMRVLDTRSTLPRGWKGANACADVHVHPGGRFVYCSNRGHDSIAAFAVTEAALEPMGHVPTGGAWPRSFCLDPDGRWLIAANQHSHDIACFCIVAGSGMPLPQGPPVNVPAPACVKLSGPLRQGVIH